MENINFIPANELPVAEGNEVSVLCVENGEMKQKPSASLGAYDAIIHIEEDYSGADPVCNITVEKGALEDIVAMIRNGRMPKVLFYGVLYYGYSLPIANEPSGFIVWNSDDTNGEDWLNFDVLWTYGKGWTYRYTYLWNQDGVSPM